MALKTAGIPARDYENDCPTIAVKLYEGDLSYNANGIDEEGRTTDMWTVSAPITKSCYVKLHEDSDARHIIVEPATSEDEIIGKLIINPKFKWTVDWTDYDKNRLPRADKTWGNYSPRTGTVEFFGHDIRYLDLVAENAKIEPMDSVAFDGDGKFDKSNSDTVTRALGGVKANKGGKIPVLAGYYGI